jgi:hypothetical protein
MFNSGALFESGIHDRLCSNGLTATATFVRGDEDATLAIHDTIAKGLCREPSKDNGMDSSDAGASKESGNAMPCHREINGDGIAFFDSKGFENIGDARDLAEELSKRNFTALSRLVGLVENSGLSGPKSA